MKKSITVSGKITFAISFIILMIIVLSLVSNYALSQSSKTFSSLLEHESVMVQEAGKAKITLLQSRRDEKDAIYNDDEVMIKSVLASLQNLKTISERLTNLSKEVGDQQILNDIQEISINSAAYTQHFQSAIASPVGQDRLRASIPMRKSANLLDTQIDALSVVLNERINRLQAAIFENNQNLKILVGSCGAFIVACGLFVAWFMRKSVVTPIKNLTNLMLRLANGDKSFEMMYTQRKDEIGDMSRALKTFQDNAIRMDNLQKMQEADVLVKENRQLRTEELFSNFSSRSSALIKTLDSVANNMGQTAQHLSSIAQTANQEAQIVSTFSNETSGSVQTVASATEEMGASISEISQQVLQAKNIVGKANQMASNADEHVQKLDVAAVKIGEIITLIQNIAEQTNLLALNATIEAARAGDAGKGFAVVASEVKNLAVQTARATEDISQHISGIQNVTKNTVYTIREISITMNEVEQFTSSIAAAIEEQNAATQEISRAVQNAANGSTALTENINNVSHAISETSQVSDMVLQVSGEIATATRSMQEEVDTFLREVAAA